MSLRFDLKIGNYELVLAFSLLIMNPIISCPALELNTFELVTIFEHQQRLLAIWIAPTMVTQFPWWICKLDVKYGICKNQQQELHFADKKDLVDKPFYKVEETPKL